MVPFCVAMQGPTKNFESTEVLEVLKAALDGSGLIAGQQADSLTWSFAFQQHDLC